MMAGALRRASQDAVLATLDACIFSRSAFAASFNINDGPTIHLVFKDQPEFKFEATTLTHGGWRVVESPGHHFVGASVCNADAFENVLSLIGAWANRIFEDVIDDPQRSSADTLREAFEKQLEQIPDAEVPFTAADAEAWRQKLDAMMERVDAIHTEQNLQRDDLFRLREEIERLKGVGTVMPRKAWLRALASVLSPRFAYKSEPRIPGFDRLSWSRRKASDPRCGRRGSCGSPPRARVCCDARPAGSASR